MPTGFLGAVTGPNEATLTWNASTDASGIKSYRLTGPGGATVTIDATVPRSRVWGGLPTGTHLFQLEAIDLYDNASNKAQVSVILTAQTFGWTFTQGPGEVYDLGNQIIDTPKSLAALYTAGPGTKPSFTVSGVGAVTVDPNTGESTPTALGDQFFTVTLIDANAQVSTSLVNLAIDGGAANAPWTTGHAFKEGDVPANHYIIGSDPSGTLSTFQAIPRNFWPDGSVKFATLSGVGGINVALAASSVAPAGTAVPAINAGDVGSTSVTINGVATSLVDAINGPDLSNFLGTAGVRPVTAGKVRDWIAGPAMRESHYYSPAAGDSYLGVFWHVRKYANGAVEVETIVENGWVNVSAPTEKTYTAKVTVNGSDRAFHDTLTTQTITHFHNTRWSRVDWVSLVTPEVEPLPDVTYLKSTKLVPNYSWPGAAVEAAFTTSTANYSSGRSVASISKAESMRPTPLGPCNLRTHSYQGGGGEAHNDQVGLLTYPDALYCKTGDIRAFRAAVHNGRNGSRHAVVFRDERTLRMPETDATTIYREEATSTVGNTPVPVGTFAVLELQHQPLLGFFAYLLTGRYVFLELCQFEALWNFFRSPTGTPWPYANAIGRHGARGLVRIGTLRAIAWQQRTCAAAACISPDVGDAREVRAAADLRYVFGENMQWLWDIQTGPCAVGTGQNNLGVLFITNSEAFAGNYPGVSPATPIKDPLAPSETFVRTSPWQQGYAAATIGWAWDLKVTPDTRLASHQSIRDHVYKFSVGHMGFAYNGTGYSWRRCDTYYEPVGYPATPATPWGVAAASFLPSWRAVYEKCLQYFGAADVDDSASTTQGILQSPQGDGGFMRPDTMGAGNPVWVNNDRQNIDYHTSTRTLVAPLSYAVDHGAPGALEAWNLLNSTLDYSDPTAESAMASYPRFVTVPRA